MMVRFLAFVLLAGQTVLSAAVSTEPRTVLNMPYAEPRNERQLLDIYAPAAGEGHPVVVWVHGGAWRIGSKDEVQLKPRAFVDHGCVFIAINYRFVPEATIEEIAGDVAKAVAWAHRHAREYGGDTGAIFAMGHSSGAQLVALISTDERYLRAEGLPLAALKGCVPIDGNTYDVMTQVEMSEARQTRPYFGSHRRLFGHEAAQRDLSAVTHATPGKGIPPFLILHVADYVPRSRTGLQAQLLRAALTENGGVAARVRAFEGKTHQSIDRELGQPGDAATATLFAFIRECLGSNGGARDGKK